MMTPPAGQRQDDERRIVELLDAHLALPEGSGAERTSIEDQLLTLVDRHFREALKPFLLARFGAKAGKSGVARYTVMINDFFTKVLAHRPEAFWRAKSAETLRKWASVVVSRQMIDFLRREKFYGDGFAAIAPLVEERRDFFKQKTGMDLSARALDLIDAWCVSGTEEVRSIGWVLRHRYIDGMTREQIANQLNTSLHTVRKVHDSGIESLRRELTD